MAMSSSATSNRVARAAVAQLRSTRDKTSNLINIAKCAGWAKREGARMLFLPECLGFMGDNADHTLDMADPAIGDLVLEQKKPLEITPFRKVLADTIASCANDENNCIESYNNENGRYNDDDGKSFTSIIEELRFIAEQSNLWISGGGVHTTVPLSELPSPDQRKIYNTHVIIDDNGQIRAHYHKIHLFDVSIPNKVNLRESKTTSPGNQLVVCDSPVGKLGLSICYDMRFSEMYVDLVQKMGAEILLMPSAFTVPTGKAHWHALLRARAIEGQCYVMAAAQVGEHNEKRQSYGHSVVYDPWGKLLADAGGYDGAGTAGEKTELLPNNSGESPVCVPSIIVSDIDLDKLASVREGMPVQQHRDSSSF